MAKRGTDHWSETYCDRRFHPPHLTGLPYWFYCRLEPGHDGACHCEAAARSFERGHPGLRNRLLAKPARRRLGR